MAKKSIIRQKNEISEGRCDWTILMSRAYCKVTDMFLGRVKAWKARYPDGLEKDDDTAYSEMFDKVPLKELLSFNISRQDLAVIGTDGKENIPKVKEFKQAFDRLADVGIVEGSPDDEDNWRKINIIAAVEYNKDTDRIHAQIAPMMADYIMGLQKKYTAFNPWIAMKFTRSQYTFRFYEFCCQWRKSGNFDLSPADIKFRFELDEHVDSRGNRHHEKYKSMRDLIKYVIEPARAELQDLYDSGDCDVCFTYTPLYDKSKAGRPTVVSFKFVVVRRDQEERPQPKPKPIEPSLFRDFNSRLIDIRTTLEYYWSNSYDKNWPARAVNELGKKCVEDLALLGKVEEYIQVTINDAIKGKVKNVPGTIHNFFDKVLGINVDKKKKQQGKE